MKTRRDPVTSGGLRVAQTQKLSSTMERNLRLARKREELGTAWTNLSTTQALGLERRGLVTGRMNMRHGRDVVLTPEGRRVAREL